MTTTMTVEDDVVLNFGDDDDSAGKENSNTKSTEENRSTEKIQSRPETPQTPKNGMWLGRGLDGACEEERDEVRSLASPKGIGLWGSPRPPGDAERLRAEGHKRRWTVTEKSG